MNDKKNLEKVIIKKNKLESGKDYIKVPPHSFSLLLMEV